MYPTECTDRTNFTIYWVNMLKIGRIKPYDIRFVLRVELYILIRKREQFGVTGYRIYNCIFFLELNVVHLFILQCVIKIYIRGRIHVHRTPLSLPANGPVTRVDALTVACVSRSLLLHGLAACRWRYLDVVLHVLVGWPIMPSTSPPSTCRPSAGCLRTIYALWNVIRALFLATTNRLCLTCDLQKHECKPPLHPCASWFLHPPFLAKKIWRGHCRTMCMHTYMDEHVLPFCFLTDKGAHHMVLYGVQSITTSPF